MNTWAEHRVKPARAADLARRDPGATPGVKDKGEAHERLAAARKVIDGLQYVLYAERRRSVLVVLQGMDASGKDGAIRDVFEGVNPQGVRVTSFKQPGEEELAHDFLWRIHRAAPGRGELGVFNRSHYESVLVERVKEIVPERVWAARYDRINEFETLLTAEGATILKFFLHVSKEEQLERLRRRVEDPERNWKMSPADFSERKRWKAYTEAYEDALTRCSTAWAPWWIVPADKKWYRNVVIAETIAATMQGMRLALPRPPIDPATLLEAT